jgi:hypothetical protein
VHMNCNCRVTAVANDGTALVLTVASGAPGAGGSWVEWNHDVAVPIADLDAIGGSEAKAAEIRKRVRDGARASMPAACGTSDDPALPPAIEDAVSLVLGGGSTVVALV